jgi:3-methyladenine DNA glycosylase AlkD
MQPTEPANPAEEVKAHLGSFQGNIPTHRRKSKYPYTFSVLSFSEQLAIWDELWRTADHWRTRLHAYFFLERHIKKETELKEMWPVIVRWQDQVDDWPLCDALAKIYTKALEAIPEEVYAQLKQWNRDENPWKRRQSLVSLLYYSRTKKRYPDFNQVEPLITHLLSDKEYYVQKGLGWALRELRNVYPEQTIAYLQTHVKQISAIAFTIAIEKLDTATINEIKALRKAK